MQEVSGSIPLGSTIHPEKAALIGRLFALGARYFFKPISRRRSCRYSSAVIETG